MFKQSRTSLVLEFRHKVEEFFRLSVVELERIRVEFALFSFYFK